MLGKIASFEFKYQITSPAFYIIFLLFFLFSFFGAATDIVQFGDIGNVHINSPYQISQVTFIASLFAIIMPTVFLSNSLLRDFSHQMDGIIFSTPISKNDYIIGRFIGAFAVVLLAFASVPLGYMVGSFMPWLDPELMGPFRPQDYLYSQFVIGLPNILLVGMLMFSVANFSRSNIATYIALVAFFVINVIAGEFLNRPEYRELAALVDPFGFGAWIEATRNWTAYERNAQLVPLSGLFLQNRLLWLGVGLVLMVINFLGFSFRRDGATVKKGKKHKALPQQRFVPTKVTLPTVTRVFSGRTARQQFVARTFFEVRAVIFSITFWVLLALGTILTIATLALGNEVFGTPVLPVTRNVIGIIVNGFGFVPFVVMVLYAADLMWRDRSAKMYEIIDGAPIPSWALLFPKLIAVSLVIIGLYGFAGLTGIIFQLIDGKTEIEYSQYAVRLLYITGWPLILMAVLAFFLQVIFNNRYLGIIVMMIYYIGTLTLGNLGFDHNLYQYAGTPGGGYSDINGYGHFLAIRHWFHLYWTFVAMVLLILAYGLYNRGVLTSLPRRIKDLSSNLNGLSKAALALSFIGAVGVGGFIFYNTNILNEYTTQRELERALVDYEKKYVGYKDADQPSIIDVKADVAIYPKQRRVEVNGDYILENNTDVPIDRVHVEYSAALNIKEQNLVGAALDASDKRHNVYFFKLAVPMQPGEKRTLTFNTEIAFKGFRNSGNGVTVIRNGTFINNFDVMPGIGFQPGRIMQSRNTRREYDLEPVDRLPKLEDEAYYNDNYLRADSDFVNFEATVSTSEDQIAIAPGYLTREWNENGRRYFHYKMDVPIMNFFSFQSADYTVKEDKWNDVAIQIFYHEPHDYNVDRMIEATQKSLGYFSKNFSPYQYRQLRILEFPYRSFAQAFPNTVPFSENIGFIADNTDPEEIDSTFYVTSHEVAHQWWAHQVMGAAVQGGAMLVETFAQYSAFMVVEKEFGEEHVRDFLKLELDRYLAARGGETVEELPLYRVENQQYIHYQKGSLVMYALKDYVGEDVVNRSLARLVELRGFKSEPYAITLDFLNILREEAGPQHDALITDLFEKITIFDLEAEDVDVTERADGKYDVTLTYRAEKFYADGEGRETPADINIPIDIGVFVKSPADGKFDKSDVLYLKKHKIDPANPVITITVDKEPGFAGIDPYVKLIDRNADNNVKRAG